MSSGIPLGDSLRTDTEQAFLYQTEDDLPDIDNILQGRAVAGRLHSRKRQKLVHKANRSVLPQHREGQEDLFAVPPSPPPSSRDSAPRTAKAPQGFRLPRGFSPVPLPTPQISSDIRPIQGNNITTLSDEDTPPRTSRRIARVRSAVTIGSDSPTDSESAAPEDDQQLLHRERRRIRGVLPASWLNIDRKAHPKSHPASSDKVERGSPGVQQAAQKGVARKIRGRSTTTLGLNVLEISDDDDMSGTEMSTPTAAQHKASDLTSRLNSVIAQNESHDVDDMELDWFDPMLAGATRAPRVSGSKTKKRSRNNNPIKKSSRLDFVEERNGLRLARNPNGPRRTGPSGKMKSRSAQRRRAPALGILDAPQDRGDQASRQPQFVRLAARQARRGPFQGRHLPSGKVIRLATHEDTEQATATLDEWRRGAIPLRKSTKYREAIARSRHSGNFAQSNPVTPHVNTIANSPIPETSSVPSRLELPRVSSESSSTRPTSHSVGLHRAQARQNIPRRQQPASAAAGPRDGKHILSKKANLPTARYRGAQLETQESAYMQQSRSAAFQQRIQCLTETVTRRSMTPTADALPMTRFLQESNPFPHTQHPPPPIRPSKKHHDQALPKLAPLQRKPRKRRTQRVDVDTLQYRQPSEPLPNAVTLQISEDARMSEIGPTLRGLGPSGTRYATDFDVRRLPTSTYFHESTFIGSGDLASALSTADRSMEQGSGGLRIYIKGSMHEWAAWSEQVSAAMAEIPSAISDAINAIDCDSSPQCEDQISAVTSNVEHMLRSTIRYISNCLYFSDAIDRRACCQALDQLVQDVIDLTEQTELWTANLKSLHRRILQSTLVIARQNQVIGNNAVVLAADRAALYDQTARVSSRLASSLVPGCMDDLRSEYEEQRVLSIREMGIRKDDSITSGFVILYQCMRGEYSTRSPFWEVVGKALNIDTPNVQASSEIDAAWYIIFSILPCLDFSPVGIIQSRTIDNSENGWRLPSLLVERCLELYPATSAVRGSSINEYVRATLTRCSYLFTKWEWWKCESILSIVYDFFARQGLNLLHCEDGHGSPEFLESLTCLEDVSLEAAADDRSFSIFLKLLATSLRTWANFGVHTDKKIGGIAWRIIPNHARIYRKDAEVQRTDLDALRNHFDLLCTLYFASPPLHRLRIDMLRNLVDHSTSHREACRISVRAWSRLASFQMSTDESTDKLTPFIDWFKDMLQTTIAQYRLARTEAEQQYAVAKASGTISLDNDVLEKTISSNQRQIAATIVDLLAAYRRALTSASCTEAARLLIIGCEPWKAIESFHPSERRLTAVYNEMLDLFNATVDVQQQFYTTTSSHTQSEDSQDYGDIDILQEFATGQAVGDDGKENNLVAFMYDAFAQLVSDAFGSETSPDDSFLLRLLDTWIQCANHMVGHGLRSWSNFLVDYNAGSWCHLRDTLQRRKFTPYALAAVLEADPNAFEALKAIFLGTWLRSLVERASTLKYQHRLTEAILNIPHSVSEPILRNLPFSKAPEAPLYQVTLQELRQRRLALISSVLSNMLEHYNEIMLNQPRLLPELGRVYAKLVQQIMQAMKSNYQELQQDHSSNTAAANVRGDYVVFVQEVVAFLQQYTIEGVYTVDRFFLDSSAFPLPADDPTYVVGRLRKHMPKLAEAKTRKQLATFLHNISERAAFDQQQVYLTDQLHKAMSGTAEVGNINAPSLRHVMLTSIIPAYIEHAIGDAFTWILALPMIDASARTVADLLYDVDMGSDGSIAAAIEQIASLLGAVQEAFAQLHMSMHTLKSPHVLNIVRATFRCCEATVVFANYIQRLTGQASHIMTQLQALGKQATRMEDYLDKPEEFLDYGMDDLEESGSTHQWPDTYAFTSKHVRESVADDWSLVNERYIVKRGNGTREVVVQVGDYKDERDGALEAIAGFRSICERQKGRGARSRRGRREGSGDAFGIDGLVI
jgi:CHASE3 domain sensor protein